MEIYRLNFVDDIAASDERLGKGSRGHERALHLDRQFLGNVTERLQFLHVRVDADQVPDRIIHSINIRL